MSARSHKISVGQVEIYAEDTGQGSPAVVWTYEDPYSAVGQIKGHVAFYPDRVDEITER